ncbi:MAG: PQQ-dependent sugar dehydrogenase [Balneolaceae bacterium]|nr:PQQ-dependent sugar dehydrogenase [Balneolaceae bacterium]MBO6546498.1 PQQ-dependent sugar dehydrogenase [Balneolaceae bacterium]MBO6648857.1 PQQ-dependent sugar dehydrogenase [Balneolaceae bacterium]
MQKLCSSISFLIILSFCFSSSASAWFQNSGPSSPEVLVDGIEISSAVTSIPDGTVRISFNKADSTLYLLTQNGGLYRVDLSIGFTTKLQDDDDHELEDTQGLDISTDGTFYIVGNLRNNANSTNVAVVKRGTKDGVNWIWETVAETEPYPLSNTAFDHIANGIVVSPDDSTLYVNSGSRTDHGEIHDVNGQYPNLREAPLTAKILRIPADTTNALLENDLDMLKSKGFVFAEGTRNSFSLAFDGEGNLFGTENSGDRDDSEELNWLREGHHYGFPWVMGGNDTPMQYEGFDPENDPFIPQNSTAANLGTFYNDPNYPDRPAGVTFTDAVTNIGPDADTYRDAEDGQIKDASDEGTTITTFSSHLSPLGLVFDVESNLGGNYTGDGFVLGFSGGTPGDAFLLTRMDYHGEDLIHMDFTKTEDNYQISATSLVRGFLNPIDAEIVGNTVYLVEHKNNSWLNTNNTVQMYAVTLPAAGTSTEERGDLASQFKLYQNYPNPFNPTTQIQFVLPAAGFVELEVYNAIGQKVTSLVNRQMTAQQHEVTFNAANMNSGVYLYSLKVDGERVQTRKMLLMK